MKYKVVKANIINIAADAVVLPANESLIEGSRFTSGEIFASAAFAPPSNESFTKESEVSTAIFSAAGRTELTNACKNIGHCNTGSAVSTPAFNLNAKCIIHAVVPKWIDGEHNEINLLRSAYLSSLNIAEEKRCESIAFPLLGSGYCGFDKQLSGRIAKESIAFFEGNYLKEVILVVYDDSTETIMNELGHEASFLSEVSLNCDRKNGFSGKRKNKVISWLKKPETQQMILGATMYFLQQAMSKNTYVEQQSLEAPAENDCEEGSDDYINELDELLD